MEFGTNLPVVTAAVDGDVSGDAVERGVVLVRLVARRRGRGRRAGTVALPHHRVAVVDDPQPLVEGVRVEVERYT